jgi:hypothetical protein
VKRVVFVVALVSALAGLSPPASAALITFNESGLVAGVGPDPYFTGAQKGTLLTDQLSSLGVMFSIGVNGAAYVSNDSVLGPAGSWAMAQNYLAVNTLPLNNTASPTTLRATFVDPLTGVAMTASHVSTLVSDWNAIPNPRVTVNAFDLAGNLIESHSLLDYWNTLAFDSTQIARLDFVDNGGDGHIIDNFQFSLNQVPEPGSILLLLSGVAIAVAGRRRRARRAGRPQAVPLRSNSGLIGSL